MKHLEFLTEYKTKVSSLKNFWQLAGHNIPAKPGIYLLVAKPGFYFQYPAGLSPIYYIGQTQSLRRRLSGHLFWHLKAQNGNRGYIVLSEHGVGEPQKVWKIYSFQILRDFMGRFQLQMEPALGNCLIRDARFLRVSKVYAHVLRSKNI